MSPVPADRCPVPGNDRAGHPTPLSQFCQRTDEVR